jgi:general secretion pathway protein B
VSFILDALKKSENERQRQAGPGFATVPASATVRPRKIWPIVVVALLAINLIVIGAALIRHRPAATSIGAGDKPARDLRTSGAEVSQTPQEPKATLPGAPSPTPVQPLAAGPTPTQARSELQAPQATDTATEDGRDREIRSLAAEAAGDRVAAPSSAPAGRDAATTTGTTPASPERPATPSQRAATSPKQSLPTSNDLRLEGFLTGPPLHLDLHVYYPESKRRVVFISGSKYREGDTVNGGPVVVEIVPEGVILEERGRRYLLMPD